MKKILYIIIIIFSFTNVYPQWEFQYFVIKLGMNHHAFSPQPDTDNYLFLKTFNGEMKLYPDSIFFPDYMPGFNIGFDFHFDFTNDMGGIIIGAHYNTYGISEKYTTIDHNYYLIRKHRIHSVSFPLYVKFGKEIFDQQRYFTAGLKYNMNFAMQTCENVNWLDKPACTWADKNMFTNNNILLFLGFNYMIFNIELDFMPKNFLNPAYSVNVGTQKDKFIVFPYKGQPQKLFFLHTNITIPLSPWITTKSYFFNRLFRIFK